MLHQLINLIDSKYFNFGGISPVWLVSKVFGMAPYINRFKKYNVAYINVFFMLFFFSTYVASFIAFQKIEMDQTIHKCQICDIGHLLHYFLGCGVCVLSYFVCAFQGNILAEHLQQTGKIDHRLYRLSGTPNNFQNISNRFQFFLIIFGILMSIATIVLDFLIFKKLYGNFVYLFFLAYTFPYVASMVVQAQFITLIYDIDLRFQEINRCLYHIANINETTSKSVRMFKSSLAEEMTTDRDYSPSAANNNAKSDTPVLFIVGNKFDQNNDGNGVNEKMPKKLTNAFERQQSEKQKPNLNSNINSESEEPNLPIDLHQNMDTLFDLHDSLFDISERVNGLYAFQIVAFITVSFVLMLFGFFFETKVIFWLWAQSGPYVIIASSFMIWAVFTGVVIYTILTICSRAREEAYESALIVHKILQNKPIFMLNDEIYYNKMKSFTLQILHRKNSFNFNGLGLFNLDYTFIFSAVSAATSYLIVLLQFDLSADLI